MSSLVVWCMMMVTVNCGISETCEEETAVKGIVVSQTDTYYSVDFSEYAIKQKYNGDWKKIKFVNKDICVKE